MKNTKILFIGLYIETLYSNFIVPLRGSNYIQLLYGDLQQGIVSLFEQIRLLVWQERINEVGQILVKTWSVFEADRLDQNLTETWLRLDDQLTTKTLPENGTVEAKMLGQKLVKTWSVLEVNQAIQNLYRNWTEILLQSYSNITLKMSSGGIKCNQNFIGLSSKNDHQPTTEIPPEIRTERRQMSVNECSFQPEEIGSNRVKSGQKIGVNRCKSVRISTDSGIKMRANECKCGQKIGAFRGKSGQKTRVICDQMLPNATKNKA